MGDLILYLIVLVLGIMVGMNLRSNDGKPQDETLPKEVKKLQEQVIVLTNLKTSLLADVKYWRDKAKK